MNEVLGAKTKGVVDLTRFASKVGGAMAKVGQGMADSFRASPAGTLIGEGIEAAAGLATGRYRNKPSGIMPAFNRAADRLTAAVSDPTKLPMMLHGGVAKMTSDAANALFDATAESEWWQEQSQKLGSELAKRQLYKSMLRASEQGNSELGQYLLGLWKRLR